MLHSVVKQRQLIWKLSISLLVCYRGSFKSCSAIEVVSNIFLKSICLWVKGARGVWKHVIKQLPSVFARQDKICLILLSWTLRISNGELVKKHWYVALNFVRKDSNSLPKRFIPLFIPFQCLANSFCLWLPITNAMPPLHSTLDSSLAQVLLETSRLAISHRTWQISYRL